MRDVAGEQSESESAHKKRLAVGQRMPVHNWLARKKNEDNWRKERRHREKRAVGVQRV